MYGKNNKGKGDKTTKNKQSNKGNQQEKRERIDSQKHLRQNLQRRKIQHPSSRRTSKSTFQNRKKIQTKKIRRTHLLTKRRRQQRNCTSCVNRTRSCRSTKKLTRSIVKGVSTKQSVKHDVTNYKTGRKSRKVRLDHRQTNCDMDSITQTKSPVTSTIPSQLTEGCPPRKTPVGRRQGPHHTENCRDETSRNTKRSKANINTRIPQPSKSTARTADSADGNTSNALVCKTRRNRAYHSRNVFVYSTVDFHKPPQGNKDVQLPAKRSPFHSCDTPTEEDSRSTCSDYQEAEGENILQGGSSQPDAGTIQHGPDRPFLQEGRSRHTSKTCFRKQDTERNSVPLLETQKDYRDVRILHSGIPIAEGKTRPHHRTRNSESSFPSSELHRQQCTEERALQRLPWLIALLGGYRTKVPRKPTKDTEAERYKNFHLHIPTGLQELNFKKVMQHMSSTSREKMNKILQLTFESVVPDSAKGVRKSTISKEHLDMMEASGLCEKLQERTRTTSSMFLVPELEKTRWRIITWPKQLNDAIEQNYKNMGTFSLNDITETFLQVQNATYGAVIDLKCSFYQVGLTPTQSNAFIFNTNSGQYRMKKLPMGLTTSAEIMQLICTQLSTDCVQVQITTHIDNILITGKKAQVEAAVSIIVNTAKEQDITIGECIQGVQVQAFGFLFNFEEKQITIAKKKMEKLQKLKSTTWKELTVRDFLSIFGKMQYYARAMWSAPTSTTTMADHFNCLQVLRQIARTLTSQPPTLSLDSQLYLTSKDIYEIKRFLHATIRSKPISTQSIKRKIITITSDASNNGSGWIIYDENERELRRTSTENISDERHINEKELHTLGEAIRTYSELQIPGEKQVLWKSDNSTAITVLQKKSSASRTLNDVCLFVLHISRIHNLPVTKLQWIPTDENAADGLSRMGIFTDTCPQLFRSKKGKGTTSTEDQPSCSSAGINLQVEVSPLPNDRLEGI